MRFYYKKACILLLSALLFSISSHAEEAGKPLTAPAEEAPVEAAAEEPAAEAAEEAPAKEAAEAPAEDEAKKA